MFIFFSTLCKLCTRRTKEAEFLLQGDRRGDVVSVSANQRPVSGQWTNKPIRGRACPLPLTSVWSDSCVIIIPQVSGGVTAQHWTQASYKLL